MPSDAAVWMPTMSEKSPGVIAHWKVDWLSQLSMV
jgi:hypothetical protein